MRPFLLILIVIGAAFNLDAQEASNEKNSGLVLQQRGEKRQFRVLDYGSKVTIRYKDFTRTKGILEDAVGDSIRVSGNYISIYDIDFIGQRKFLTDAAGVLMIVTGAGFLTAGIVTITSGSITTSVLAAGLGAGVGIMGAGLLRDGRRYYLDGDWRVMRE